MNKENESKDSKFRDRQEHEAKEGYETVKTEQPSGRFQETKQVLKPDELGVTTSSIPGTSDKVTTSNLSAADAAKHVKSKVKIRPDVSVEELKNKQVGGVPLSGDGAGNGLTMRSVAGFSTGFNASAADDTSRTPYSDGKYRPATRYGKKRSEDLFEIDNTISEQLVPVVEESKDLREAPEAKQGYNGRKQFKQTRSKKNFSDPNNNKVPQELLNEASVDFVYTSQKVYTCGQVVDTQVVNSTAVRLVDAQADYPTVKSSAAGTTAAVGVDMRKSNYTPRSLSITFADGKISAISIDERRDIVEADPITRDQANMNWQIDANNVAKSMVRMQTELGRETTDKWSPLAYVIAEPYQYNMLMHDIEATTGAIQAIAYRAAVSSMAFQRNILAKDGVNLKNNAIKMIMDGYAGTMVNDTSSFFTDSDFDHVLWDESEYVKGSAAALIAAWDSTKKYRSKADFLGMQRSFGLHLAQADNNINPLHCKSEFIRALDKAHLFSTIDGNYNPLLPIFATRKIQIVNPLSLNSFLVGWKHPDALSVEEKADPLRDTNTGTYANYAYSYKDLRNTYVTRVQHPLVEGLIRWLLKHEGALASVYGNNPVVIPFTFDFTAPSMLQFMLCSASQDIIWERNIIMRDVLFAGEQQTYVWDDLASLKELNPLASSQLTIGKYDEPLKLGKLGADTAVRLMWHQGMTVCKKSGNNRYSYFAPWYFNERSFGDAAGGSYSSRAGFFDESTPYNMTIPSIRDGVRHEYVDIIKSMDERDIRLSLDRAISIPVFNTHVDPSSSVPWTVNQTDATAAVRNERIKLGALRYENNSDGRVVVTYNFAGSNHVNDHKLYEDAQCLVAKELGWIGDAETWVLGDYISSYTAEEDHGHWRLTFTANAQVDETEFNGGYPYYMTSYRVESLSTAPGSIDRSAALTQVFFACIADPLCYETNQEFVVNTGIVPAMSYQIGRPFVMTGVYNMASEVASTNVLLPVIKTSAPSVWTGIQRSFFAINPFENCFSGTFDYVFDPLENGFYFGVCGTLASDYTQDVLERLDINDQLGLDYTEDVFIKASPIFR